MAFILLCAACGWIVLLGYVVVLCRVTKQADENLASAFPPARRFRPERRVRNLAVAFERRVSVYGQPPWQR